MRRGFRIAIVTVVSLVWGGAVSIALVIGSISDLLTSVCTDACKPTHHLMPHGHRSLARRRNPLPWTNDRLGDHR